MAQNNKRNKREVSKKEYNAKAKSGAKTDKNNVRYGARGGRRL